jgi:hypothetical protein
MSSWPEEEMTCVMFAVLWRGEVVYGRFSRRGQCFEVYLATLFLHKKAKCCGDMYIDLCAFLVRSQGRGCPVRL